MGVRFPSAVTNVILNNLPASATEVVICTTPPLNIPVDFATVLLMWMFSCQAGTGCTGFVVRIRRGTTVNGVLVGAAIWLFTTVAGNTCSYGASYFDTPGAVAGQQYSLTVAPSNATGAAVPGDASLIAFVL